MELKTGAVAVAGALVLGIGGGYLGGLAGNETSAAETRPPVGERSTAPVMGAADGSMMRRHHARMMRDPAMRRHHDGAKTFPRVAHMMREHMEG